MSKRMFRNTVAGLLVLLFLFSLVAFAQSFKLIEYPHLFVKLYARLFILDPVDLTIPAGAGVAEYTVATPSKATYEVTCSDTDGCRFYVGETNIGDGQMFLMAVKGSNTVTVVDVAGVRELSSDFAGGDADTLTMQYLTDRWVQVSEENN